MYSKEYDRNLKISQIHYKRKEVTNDEIKIFRKVLSMALAIFIIGSGIISLGSATASNQLIILDTTYDHTTSTKAFSFFNIPSGIPSNLISPVNYAQGTLYQRLQVLTKPSSKNVKYQICLFQDQIIPSKHACSNEYSLSFTGTGTHYANQPVSTMFQYNNINWGRSLLTQMLVVKDINGKPVDDRYGFAGAWSGSPNFGLYYPMKVRYTAIIVPPGGGPPVWPGSSSGNSITVTSPNGEENLQRGTTNIISWSSVGSPGANVKVELLKNGALNTVITSSTANDGSHSWTVPSTQASGSDYKIRVTSTSNSVYTDTSNSNFAIGTGVTTSTNIIKNPGFESGTTSWLFYTSGAGTFGTISPGYEGTSAAKSTLNSGGTNIQLYQTGMMLQPNTRYRLTFLAKSTTGHDLTVKLFKHVSPYTSYGLSQTFSVGTGWQTFTTEFTTRNFASTTNDGRFQFWLAPFVTTGDIYYIDNVRLEKL